MEEPIVGEEMDTCAVYTTYEYHKVDLMFIWPNIWIVRLIMLIFSFFEGVRRTFLL